MGNFCIKERKPQPTLFDPPDLHRLNTTFNHYCDLYPEFTRETQKLSKTNFEEIFIENPEFGRKLFQLLETFQAQEKYIDRQALFPLLEVLIKDASTAPQLKSFDKFELMTLISLKQTEFLQGKEELHNLKLTYLDTIQIVNDFLRIRLAGDQYRSVDEKVSRSLLDQIFKQESGFIEWFEVVKILKNRLPGASTLIKRYFQNKFMQKPMVPSPLLTTNSYLLNEDWVYQLQMGAFSTQLKDCLKLELLYSSVIHHEGFPQMVDSMVNSKLPTLLLVQHEESYTALHDQSVISKQHIFGAISNSRWFDTAQPQGDVNDSIFQMYPNFQVYRPKKQRNAKLNFCYLNTKDNSKPIGIGYGYGEKCRIWIDQDIQNGSYCTSQDDTYENGDLVSKHIKKLQINVVEVWGIVHASQEEDLNLKEGGERKEEIQEPDQIESKADYYWVTKEEEKTGLFADFYWVQAQQAQETETQQRRLKLK